VNQWVGHVVVIIRASEEPPNPFVIPSVQSFYTANYEGFYTIPTETISEGFGSTQLNNKKMVLLQPSIQRFCSGYRMRSTRPAGCYILNVNDDGYVFMLTECVF
jgi:hypothetical protein